MTDHAGFLELAARQIDFDLTPVEAARLEAHLAACAPCRLKVERLRADSTALRSFGWYDAPATLEDVVLTAALHGRGRSAPRPWALGFAAALALAVLAGGALGGGAILEGLLVGARPTIPAPSVPASAEAPSVAPTAVQGGSPTPRPSGFRPGHPDADGRQRHGHAGADGRHDRRGRVAPDARRRPHRRRERRPLGDATRRPQPGPRVPSDGAGRRGSGARSRSGRTRRASVPVPPTSRSTKVGYSEGGDGVQPRPRRSLRARG